MTVGCGADDTANEILASVTADGDFTVTIPDLTGEEFQIPEIDPESDLYKPVPALTLADLTTKTLDGSGAFDVLMQAVKAHLKGEYEGNRISGTEYTKAYIASVEVALGQGVQFLLTKDASHWASINAQLQAQANAVQLVTARVQLESAKAQLSILTLEAQTRKVEYAATKMTLATRSVEFCLAEADLANAPHRTTLLLKQIDQVAAQITGINKQNILLDDEHSLASAKADMLAKQIIGQTNQNSMILKQIEALTQEIAQGPDKLLLLKAQVEVQQQQVELIEKQVDQMDKELLLYPAKQALLEEQMEAQRAQTTDTRSDGTTPITGVLGTQKDLYLQQIVSYKRDAEVKAAKIFTDAWITMKTLDEGLAPPTAFANSNLDTILATVKTVNNL